MNSTGLTVPGYTGEHLAVSLLSVAPDFFTTMQIPVLLGREIGRRDIGSTAADRDRQRGLREDLFPGQNPIGKRFSIGKRPERLRSRNRRRLQNGAIPLAQR